MYTPLSSNKLTDYYFNQPATYLKIKKKWVNRVRLVCYFSCQGHEISFFNFVTFKSISRLGYNLYWPNTAHYYKTMKSPRFKQKLGANH